MKNFFILPGVFLLVGFVQAANMDWDNGAVSNVGWHTAANWAGDIVPGSVSNHNVILNGATDAPFVVQNISPSNSFDITMRNGATLTIEAGLLNVDDFYLGPNANNGGSVVEHSSGTVAAKQVKVGANPASTSDSSYTLSGDAEVVTTADLYVGKGTLSIDGSGVSISVGHDLNLSNGGNLTFKLGEYVPASIDVANSMSIHPADSVLTIDGSFYRGGSDTFELVRFGARSGSFAETNVVIKGFKANQSAFINYDDNSLNLTITTETVADAENQLWFTITPNAGTEAASFFDLLLNNGHHASTLNSSDLTCTQAQDGDDLVYSISWAGNDFDADGTADTVAFDLRVSAYTGTSFFYSTNAASSSITAQGSGGAVYEENGRWGVGSDVDLDEGESLYFSVDNVQIAVPGYSAEVHGFTGFGLNEVSGHTHTHIRGDGVGGGLDSGVINYPADYSFPALNPLMVTCAGTGTGFGFQIDSVIFSLTVRDPAMEPVWDVHDYSYSMDGIGYVEPYPEQSPVVEFPEFSWDEVPRWLAVRNVQAYSAEQIGTIATNYQLVMLEKSNKNGLTYTEEGQVKMANDLKEVSPSIKVITYWNAGLFYTDYKACDDYDLENWSQTAVDGNGAISYPLQRDLLYKYDKSVEAMRDWWVDVAVGMATNENVDGVFIDVPAVGNPRFYDEDGNPSTESAVMFDNLRAQMPADKMLVGNALRSEHLNGHRQLMECFDGSYLERWLMWDRESLIDQTEGDVAVNSIQLMREALALGKMINLQSSPDGPGIEDDPAPTGSANMTARRAYAEKYVDFPLAVFLIIAETNAYFGYNMGVNVIEESYNDDVWDTSFIAAFNRPLGEPLGDPVRDGYIYTRSYEHVDVWLDVDTKETVFAWDSVDTDADGLNDLWEYRHFGNVTNAVPADNPDGDAYNNLQEYAFGGDPMNGSDIGYVPTAGSFNAGGTNFFEYVYARRTTPGNGLAYWLETSSNLLSNDWKNSGYTERPNPGTLDSDFEAVTNWIDMNGKTNEYIRLKIETQME